MSAGRKRVVIVGCGPGGLCAAVSLARAGCTVQVIERRPPPSLNSGDDDDRAFMVALAPRGRAALQEAGFQTEEFERPGSGLTAMSSRTSLSSSWLPWKRQQSAVLQTPLLLGSRQTWVRLMLEQAERMGLDIAVRFDTACEAVDVEGRTVTIRRGGDAPAEEVPYDLLVGADGAYSKVRRCLQAALPGELRVCLEASSRQYKVLADLPSAEFGGGRQVLVFPPVFSDPYSSIMVVPRSGQEMLCGRLTLKAGMWEGLRTADDYAAFLASNFPRFPASCVPQVAEQLAKRSAHVAGNRVVASTFHGPAVVLIGDAAHAVLPLTGSGMNSALEDGALLAQLLAVHGGDVTAVPAAFTRKRKPESEAQRWLDLHGHIVSGVDGGWSLRWLLYNTAVKGRAALRALLGNSLGGNSHSLLYRLILQSCMPYPQIKHRVILEEAAVAAGVLAAACAAAGWLLLS